MSKVTKQQLSEFQESITKVFQCCQDRIHYQSEKFSLPDAELRCMMLFGDERYLTPKGISQKMKVVKSRVSKILLGLEKKKLIRRLKDPEDSRGYILTLTPSGKKKIIEIKRFYDDVHREVLSKMSDGQRNILLNNLNLLKTCMEAGKELMN